MLMEQLVDHRLTLQNGTVDDGNNYLVMCLTFPAMFVFGKRNKAIQYFQLLFSF